MDTTFVVFLVVLSGLASLGVGLPIGFLLASRRSGDADASGLTAQVSADNAQLMTGIDRLSDHLRHMDNERAAWSGRFDEQVQAMQQSNELLRRETGALSTALRKPAHRGQWGEQHLRRTVEMAGMVDHCDFTEQVTRDTDAGRIRPDLVVHLAGGREIVVDSKVPLEAHLDAVISTDDEEARHHLRRHALQVRQHVKQLGSKHYWAGFASTPEFVVLFLPTEAAMAAALEHDSDLLEFAADHQVVLASPTTLIALLRTVAHGWTTEALATNAQEIHQLGRVLHERVSTMAGHFETLGRSLTSATKAYNKAIGSLESRVMVTAREFEDMQVTSAHLRKLEPSTEPVRQMSDARLIDAATLRQDVG